MLGIAVFWATVALCSASLNVENELHEIRRILFHQEKEIQELKTENQVLRNDLAKFKTEIEKLTADDEVSEFGKNITVSENEEIQLRNSSVNLKTLIRNADAVATSEMENIRMSRLAPEPVAFYAYISNNEPNPSLHHAIIFDVVKTNVGGGYNEYSGMFTAPSSGIFVFTWTIYTGARGQTKFHIFVNHDVFDATFSETDNNPDDFDSDSGSMVVSLNVHDNVYMRSAMACTTNIISSSVYARTTFAGWKIMTFFTISILSTLLAFGTIPLNLLIYSGSWTDRQFVIPFSSILVLVGITTVPLLIGIVIRWRLPKVASVILKIGSYAGVLLVALSLVMLSVLYPFMYWASWKIYIAAISYPYISFMFGYVVSTLFKMENFRRRTIALETGMQNYTLCFAILEASFSPVSFDVMSVFPLLYGVNVLTAGFVFVGIYKFTEKYGPKPVLTEEAHHVKHANNHRESFRLEDQQTSTGFLDPEAADQKGDS